MEDGKGIRDNGYGKIEEFEAESQVPFHLFHFPY
jgi:hypothetical protein